YRSIPLELKKGILGQRCRPFLTRPNDDLIYIDDVIDAVSRALFAEKRLSRAYNIGLDKIYVSKDLKQAIQKALPNLHFEIGEHPNGAGGRPHRLRNPLDNSLRRPEVDWKAKNLLEGGNSGLAAWVLEPRNQLEV